MSLLNLPVDEQRKIAAWRHAQPIPGYDPAIWRRDRYGSAIRHSDYGNMSSEYGWEIDHAIPLSRGGTDSLDNLQALHWKNNRAKSDSLI